MSNVITYDLSYERNMCIQMVIDNCKKLHVLHKQTSFGRKLSVQRQTKVKTHMSYVVVFDI